MNYSKHILVSESFLLSLRYVGLREHFALG